MSEIMPKTKRTRTSIPSQAEYERNEIDRALREERQHELAPLADRKDAQASFLEAMRSKPEVVGERVSWLLAGNYGYGAMVLAKRVLASPRMNRKSALTQLTAVYDWMCPRQMAIDAWKRLTAQQKEVLDRVLDLVIAAAEKEEE